MKRQERLVYELQRYLFDEVNFEEFYDWFTPWSWSVAKTPCELTATITKNLTAYVSGQSTENELKESLKRLVDV